MNLDKSDMSLLLAGLKLVSNDNFYTGDQQRKAKNLEDKIGANFSNGCTLNCNPFELAKCGDDVVIHATQTMADFDEKPVDKS